MDARTGTVLLLLAVLGSGCRSVSPSAPPLASFGDRGRCPDPQLLHYRLSVVLDPVHHRLRGRAEMELSCLPPDGLQFELNPRLFLESSRIDGRRVQAADSPVGYSLRYQGEGSAPVVVELGYEGKLRQMGTPLNELSEDLIELSAHSSWYPRFAAEHAFTAEVSVHAPSRYRLVALGQPGAPLTVSGGEGETLREWSWRTRIPVSELLLVGSPHLRSVEVVDRGERFTSYYSTLPSEQVETLTATLAYARGTFSDALGEAQAMDESILAFVPRSGPGYQTSGFCVLSEESVRTSSTSAELLVHALSRAWWSVAESARAAPGAEGALASFYAERVLGRGPTSQAAGLSVALLFELERRVGRDALDGALRALRARETKRPLPWSTLSEALEHAFGAALVEASQRAVTGDSAPQQEDQEPERDQDQPEQ